MRCLILSFRSLIALLIIFHSNLFAQKQNSIWYFGDQAGLDFNTNPPTALTSNLFTLEGTASIADPAGHLLFYTNGATLWDRQHNVMPNGSGLLGGESSTQAALIITRPNSCQTYYVFMTEDHLTDGGLTYSTVDMCLNNGFGDVVSSEKNILLQNRTAEKITAVLHTNGVDIWVITHKLGSNEFLAYLVTSAGINTIPVVSAIGANYPFDAHIGPAKASHNGTKIASSASFRNICELFDFDRSTGMLSNQVNLLTLLPSQSFIYGIEFSPNDSLLYLSSFFVTSQLLQLDIASLQLTTLNSIPGNYIYGALQSGPDNKIYMARFDSSFVDVIHQPNIKGTSCQYEERGQLLAVGTLSQSGLPNFAPYSFFRETIAILSLPGDTSFCMGDSLVLELNAEVNCPTAYLWNDGSTGNVKVVTQSGIYWVDISSSCLHFRDSIKIDVHIDCPSGQTPCQQNYFSVLGSLIEDETGFCITSSSDQTSIYLGGSRGDSALILKIDPSGQLDWTRSFAFVPGEPNHIYGIIVDSEGKVVISGFAGQQQNGGTIFIARYDADINKILWAKKLVGGSDNFNLGLIELGAGGDYLISNNPVSPNVAELIRIDRMTGNIVNNFCKQYDLGSSETICDLTLVNGRLFGCGRFSDGGSVNEMRNTIFEFDINNGNVLWMKLGHKPGNVAARLYGWDIIAADNDLFSIYSGDENSGSLSNTKIYVQRTGFDGQLKWIKEFDLPGNNDWVDELIESDNGLVIMARNRIAPSDLILFKIDYDGKFVWAKQFDYSNNDNGIAISGSMSQLISVDNHFFFTGFAEENGNSDLVLIKTDLEGNISDTCSASKSIFLSSKTLVNPVFYAKSPIVKTVTPAVQNLVVGIGIATSIQTHLICGNNLPESSMISQTICSGRTFEGYSQPGTYVDTFTITPGCDSIRTLILTVLPAKTSVMDLEICQGDTYAGYSQSGVYTDTLTSSAGCDSIRTLQLTVASALTSLLKVRLCQGAIFEGYTQTGIYMDTLSSVFGCDSIRMLDIELIPEKTSTLHTTGCTTFSDDHPQSSFYLDTLQSFEGCDSIVTVYVDGYRLYIPNVFSPNDDQVNDHFEVYAFPSEPGELESFLIFDRFGDLVYSAENWPVKWDGKDKNGSYFNPGVYTYVITYHCEQKMMQQGGTITLVR